MKPKRDGGNGAETVSRACEGVSRYAWASLARRMDAANVKASDIALALRKERSAVYRYLHGTDRIYADELPVLAQCLLVQTKQTARELELSFVLLDLLSDIPHPTRERKR